MAAAGQQAAGDTSQKMLLPSPSELDNAAPKSRGGLFVALGLGAMAIAGSAVGMTLWAKRKPVEVPAPMVVAPPPPVAPKPVEPPPKPSTVKLSFKSDPDGAEVWLEAQLLGQTPGKFEVPVQRQGRDGDAQEERLHRLAGRGGAERRSRFPVADAATEAARRDAGAPRNTPLPHHDATPTTHPAEKPATPVTPTKPTTKLRDLKDPFATP